MLILRGKLRAILDVPSTTNRKTGEVYEANTQIQVESVGLSHGVQKIELHTIRVADPKPFRGQLDKDIDVQVRAYAPGGRVTLIQPD